MVKKSCKPKTTDFGRASHVSQSALAQLLKQAAAARPIQVLRAPSTLVSRLRPALLRKAYLACEQGAGALLWLRPGSALTQLRPRPPYVAFFDVTQSKRPYMSRASLIDPGWLPAASPALTSLSPPKLELAPRYDGAADSTQWWVEPTYGAARWVLPVVPRPVPADAGANARAALFARALCDGAVLRALRPFADELGGRARSLETAQVRSDILSES